MARKVGDVMTKSVNRCGIHDSLVEAAHVMWDGDCGFVPVEDLDAGKLAGVVTDRDACMAAALQGRPLAQIPVTEVMTTSVATVKEDDPLERAIEKMSEHQLRRLPVVDERGALVGVLSMNDLFRSAATSGRERADLEHALAEAMARICEPHHAATP